MMKNIYFILICLLFACSSSKQQGEASYEVAQIQTPQGEMLFWLYEETPKHKQSFLELAQAHYWDTLTFNRVIEGFVIQGGCPDTPEGFGDSPYLIEPEFKDHIKHSYGALGAGRDDNPQKLSAGCQLYIVANKEGIPRLDGNYMIFGQMITGFEVLDSIAKMPTDSLDQPLEAVPMEVRVARMSKRELAGMGFVVGD